MHKLITGISFNNKWKLIYENSDWVAFIVDPKLADTGAPELKAVTFEALLEKIKIFEQGGTYYGSFNT